MYVSKNKTSIPGIDCSYVVSYESSFCLLYEESFSSYDMRKTKPKATNIFYHQVMEIGLCFFSSMHCSYVAERKLS